METEGEGDEDFPNPNQQRTVDITFNRPGRIFRNGLDATNEQIIDGKAWRRSAHLDNGYQKVCKYQSSSFAVNFEGIIFQQFMFSM